ncbi:MAG: RNA polymerase sigma factor RpoH [Rhodospirillaceae bacterium]|jgi:RNA polymerase sigma-32 factor|nr:RNA polymerase sigma factor RpoH [Rhodospirillaceae bacterium]
MTSTMLPILSSDRGLSAYMQDIKRFPFLEKQEEFMLAKRFIDRDDTEAAHKMVTSHLRLVAKIAMGYRFYGLPVSDLISEGNVGLMRAVKKFDPDRGFRLSTYAMWWIKAAINEHVLNSWSLVKLGTVAAQKKLFFNLRKLKAKLNIYEDGDLSIEAADTIAERLDVKTSEVHDMNRRLSRSDSSLNVPVGEDGDLERIDLLMSGSLDQESVMAEEEERTVAHSLLTKGLSTLNERERRIIEERRLSEDPRTLEDLGIEYGISRERVRQIENRAFEKLQIAVRSAVKKIDETTREPMALLGAPA